MKRLVYVLVIGAVWLFMTGCGSTAYLENQQFVLTEGLDFDENNKLVVFTSTPVFNEEATNKYKISSSLANSLRDSKRLIDSKTSGRLAYGKSQNLLIGKKLLQQRNGYPYLDVLFRDSRNEINGNVIMINGTVKDVMYTNMSDKGRVANVIKQLVDSSYEGRVTVKTTLQKFHQQMKDKGMTPALTEITSEKNDLVVTGTALLHQDGTYAASLNLQESSLLLLLQRDTKNYIPLTFHLPAKMFHTNEKMSFVSFNIKKAKSKFKAIFEDDHLAIDIAMKVHIDLTERMFEISIEEEKKKLEQAIENELKKECEALIKKAQKYNVDPFQFGIYVRAYHNKNWKKIEDNWGGALSEATINVSPKVTIESIGASE